jgi:hypothetical protein
MYGNQAEMLKAKRIFALKIRFVLWKGKQELDVSCIIDQISVQNINQRIIVQ